jgi:hypothetical protein
MVYEAGWFHPMEAQGRLVNLRDRHPPWAERRELSAKPARGMFSQMTPLQKLYLWEGKPFTGLAHLNHENRTFLLCKTGHFYFGLTFTHSLLTHISFLYSANPKEGSINLSIVNSSTWAEVENRGSEPRTIGYKESRSFFERRRKKNDKRTDKNKEILKGPTVGWEPGMPVRQID